jgi:hypothetical protein
MDGNGITLQQTPVGEGSVGALTADLRGSLLGLIDRETSA